ncbi:MAG: (Fe-S)-binding protein [Candidatus Kariarchaeaceae archaeon]|jgi:Fe-S oxidoreductase
MSSLDIFRASAFGVFLLVSLYFTFDALWQLYKVLKRGNPDPERTGNWLARIKLVIINVFGQKKMIRNIGGYGHLVIFWGFIFVTTISTEVFIRAFFPDFSLSFLGFGYDMLLWIEDIISLGVLIALLAGFLRRYVYKPIRFQDRLEHNKGLNRDATIILLVVALHSIFAFLLESIEIATNNHPRPDAPPIANILSDMWAGFDVEAIEHVVWWLHSFSVWGFLIYIFATNVRVPKFYPSKHFHIIAAAINIGFGNLKPAGRLYPMAKNMDDFETLMEEAFDDEAENKRSFALSMIDDLRWPQMLDLYSCTGCGRCQELCPAFLNDQPLSPKALILNMRERLLENASIWRVDAQAVIEHENSLIGGVVPHETVWACTTCNACADACPVFIEHIDKIVDMRRYQVMVESEFPSGLDNMFNGIETNSNPWNISKADRDLWAEDLDVKRMKDHPNTAVLFWIGCAGSFDERAKKVSTALVKILRNANIDFAILGKEENCTGDPARRIGNEYLAQTLMEQNVDLLNSYNFKEVITFCPHCYNNLANELPDFGGHYRVIHGVDYVADLLRKGKIKMKTSDALNITYHDSCYLGRHNGIYSSPREIMRHFEGVNFVEMEMSNDKALCCGAGGGRNFYENEGGTDINKMRVKMAEKTGTDTIGVSCPFCIIMLEDGVKNLDSKLEILDLMEIVASHLND